MSTPEQLKEVVLLRCFAFAVAFAGVAVVLYDVRAVVWFFRGHDFVVSVPNIAKWLGVAVAVVLSAWTSVNLMLFSVKPEESATENDAISTIKVLRFFMWMSLGFTLLSWVVVAIFV